MTATATADGLTPEQIKFILETPIRDIPEDSAQDYLDALKAEDARIRESLINGLTGATAVIHIVIGGKLFVLNGLGFLTLLGMRHLLPKNEAYQQYARDGLIGYTALTAGAYFVNYGVNGFENILGLSTKLVELALLRVLWSDRKVAKERLERVVARAERRRQRAAT